MRKAYLILENGTIYEGVHFGASGTVRGELVFTTGMTGCAESLTDPNYHGQIVLFTFPQLANYGINREDRESAHCHLKGVVVREYCDTPSNFRCELTVDAFLKQEGVVGVAGIDTRALTQIIRDQDVMNAAITTEAPATIPAGLTDYAVTGGVEATSVKEPAVLLPDGPAKYSVALLDYGAKQSIGRSLLARGCKVTVFPYDTPAETILAAKPDGVILSNGPGNPAGNSFCITQIQALLGSVPLFGIGLGHQMMALASGGKTTRLKFGHRGANQPVKDLQTGKVHITNQNHGYVVDASSLTGTAGVVRCVNVNDGSCEGVDYPSLRAFSLQYHPGEHSGPFDCQNAYDRFTAIMEGD